MRLFGMEPERWRPWAIGGGVLFVLVLILRGRSGSAPAVDTGGTQLTSGAGALVQAEADTTEAAARRLQVQEMERESVFAEALRSLQLRERQIGLDVLAAQGQAVKQIASLPVACPPDYKPIRNPATGDVQCVRRNVDRGFFGNLLRGVEKTLIRPAARVVRDEIVPNATRAAYYSQGGF